MKERPILFSAPMVRAILDGTKTQTRQVVKQQIIEDERFIGGFKLIGPGGVETAIGGPLASFQFPYGSPGDRLWVRENFCPIYPQDPTYNGGRPIEYDYAATYQHGNRLGDSLGIKKRWKPSIHMPRAASRITLEITGVRVERLQDISEADAIAEGIEKHPTGLWLPCAEKGKAHISPVKAYRDLWESINTANRPKLPSNPNSKRYARVKAWLEKHPDTTSWDANPWVWVVEFKRLEQPA